MGAKLIIDSDAEPKHQEIAFDRPRLTIGRKTGNDLQYNRPEISGTHASFLAENGLYFVMDLGSTNGTRMNGAPLIPKEKYPFNQGDVVMISPYRITLVVESDISATVLEMPALKVPPKDGAGGTPQRGRISTGTAEHDMDDFEASLKEQSGTMAAGPAAPAKPAPAKPAPAQPKPPAAPSAPAAPSPAAPVQPAAQPAAPVAQPAAPRVVAAPRPAPPVVDLPSVPAVENAMSDYVWLGIGAVIVLLALGIILLVLMNM
jgi:pSer/pThr/pTyr-binding forkhead associated (FHA) protein